MAKSKAAVNGCYPAKTRGAGVGQGMPPGPSGKSAGNKGAHKPKNPVGKSGGKRR